MGRDDRGKRQLKVDFSSEEIKGKLKDLADELGISYSHLVEFFVRTGIRGLEDGKSGLMKVLKKSKLPWLRDYDIDFDDEFWDD